MHNRREQSRVPFVSVSSLTRLGVASTRDIFVQDICRHGIGIHSPEEFQKGEQVLVQLIFSVNPRETMTESILGEVVWTNPPQRGIHYSAGIRFKKKSRLEEEKPKLFEYIKRLENNG
ncbi:MAG: PilZ domain-containing protein [Candidatus Manganitrophus sp.]|nr:PilZ domain-containing protein [Candidatus Manganitrophus sp.]